MSIREVTMYRVVCDGKDCGACAQEDGDYYAWTDAGQAEGKAEDADWITTGDGKHYCPDCTTWDDDRDDRVPKPEKVAP